MKQKGAHNLAGPVQTYARRLANVGINYGFGTRCAPNAIVFQACVFSRFFRLLFFSPILSSCILFSAFSLSPFLSSSMVWLIKTTEAGKQAAAGWLELKACCARHCRSAVFLITILLGVAESPFTMLVAVKTSDLPYLVFHIWAIKIGLCADPHWWQLFSGGGGGTAEKKGILMDFPHLFRRHANSCHRTCLVGGMVPPTRRCSLRESLKNLCNRVAEDEEEDVALQRPVTQRTLLPQHQSLTHNNSINNDGNDEKNLNIYIFVLVEPGNIAKRHVA